LNFGLVLYTRVRKMGLEVIAEGNRVVVKVDGQTTADYSDPERRFPRGHILLFQVNEQIIEFRKIEIKELPATKDN